MGELAGKPNYFVEKIWMGLTDQMLGREPDILEDEYLVLHLHKFDEYWDNDFINSAPKLHTIREDASDRWREGTDIHFVINNRTKNRFQFAPVVKCTGVQEIEIKWNPIDTNFYFNPASS